MKKRINITIDEKSLYIIDKIAADWGMDRSSAITHAIRYLDDKEYGFCKEYDSENE